MTSSAVPTDRIAETAKTAGSDQPNPSIRIPARTGPTANPIGPDAPKIAIVVPRRALRRDVADARQHHPGVAELEAR